MKTDPSFLPVLLQTEPIQLRQERDKITFICLMGLELITVIPSTCLSEFIQQVELSF